MKKNGSIFVVVLCLGLCLIFSACGQANTVSEHTVEPSPEHTMEPSPELTPEPIDYKALAEKLNGDIISPVDEALAEIEADQNAEAGTSESGDNNDGSTPEIELDAQTVQNALVSGGVFEAGDNCVIYRFWSAGIDKEIFDLLGSDGTESSAVVYSELLKTFVANYDALQKAVVLYEPDAVLVLHIVENSESTDPIIVVENGEVTYDYATEQGYFVTEEAEAVEEAAD